MLVACDFASLLVDKFQEFVVSAVWSTAENRYIYLSWSVRVRVVTLDAISATGTTLGTPYPVRVPRWLLKTKSFSFWGC